MNFKFFLPAIFMGAAVLLVSCGDDDDNGGGTTPPPAPADYVTFDLGGAIEGERTGISIATNDITANGSLFTFEHLKPITEPGGAWKLTILYNGGDTLMIEPGTYTIGNQEAFDDGLVDFTALYLDELNGEPVSWNPFEGVTGAVIVTEILGDEFISGTFEVVFTDDNLGVLTISNGDFRSRYFENYF